MRVLLVIDHFGSGGAQRQLVYLAEGLKRRGHHVECFVYYDGFAFFRPRLDTAGIPVRVSPKRSRLGLGVVRSLRRCIATGGFECVVAFMETPSLYAEAATLGLKSVRLLVSERVDPEPGRTGVMLRFRAACHRRATWIVTNSHTCLEEWRRRFPSLASRMAVVWNGVDLDAFSRPTGRRVARDVRVLLAVGTVVPRKNAHGVIEALGDLRRRGHTPPSVWWLGKKDPSPEGQAYYSRLVSLIEENGVVDYWKWCGEQSDLTPFLASADAVLHASFREGLSNAICEAFAAGRPVLAANRGDNPRLIDADRGMLFDPQDSAAIATCIEKFCALPTEQRMRMEAAARDFAERELDTDRFVTHFEQLMVAVPDRR